jgi:chorismate dehydratase
LDTIKIGAVNYLNTKPLIYGFKNTNIVTNFSLVEDYPANIANMLLNNVIDIGLVPVAIIPKINKAQIIGDYCIGALGNVVSVALFSNVEIHKITKVILDYQSKTSVALTKILFAHFYKQDVEFVEASPNFISEINNNTAAVIIGDRALQQLNNFKFVYDLSAAWQQFTNLPFVFAAWVANKPIEQNFIDTFNAANKFGLDNLQKVIANTPFIGYDIETYFTQNISYSFDAEKQKGLQLFFSYLQQQNL